MRMVSLKKAVAKYRQQRFLDRICDDAEIQALYNADFLIKWDVWGAVAYVPALDRGAV